jgi:archaellum component FlaC
MQLEDVIAKILEDKADAYEKAQRIIETQEKEILRLGALYEDVAREAAMFKDTLEKLIAQVLEVGNDYDEFRVCENIAEELKRWMEEREKE